MVFLRFLGTGGIEGNSPSHSKDTAIEIESDGESILIDWGLSHKDREVPDKVKSIFLSHCHKDHSGGLEGVDKTVYMSNASNRALDLDTEVIHFRRTKKDQCFEEGDFTVYPFEVIHSVEAPTVGYKVDIDELNIVVAPDVLWIPGREEVLQGTDVYIGNGNDLNNDLVEKSEGLTYGNASVNTQLQWCKNEGIETVFFTHFDNSYSSLREEVGDEFGSITVYEATDNSEFDLDFIDFDLLRVNEVAELIRDIDSYDPEDLEDEVLFDDWRLLVSYTSKLKEMGEW